MISTEIAATSACARSCVDAQATPRSSPPRSPPPAARTSRDPVGQRLDRRPAALRRADQRDDLAEPRLGAHRASPASRSCRSPLSVPPVTAAPVGLFGRHRLAGQHRFVDVALALGDLAVDRHRIARPHAQQIARRRPASSGTSVSRPPAMRCAVFGARSSSARMRIAGRLARPQLQHLADEHQRDDHRRRLEIDRRPPSRRSSGTARRQQRHDRKQIGGARPRARSASTYSASGCAANSRSAGRTAAPPTAPPASPAPARSSRPAVRPIQSRNRQADQSPIDRTRIGTLSAALTRSAAG